jgi:DNA-binding protein H-NS
MPEAIPLGPNPFRICVRGMRWKHIRSKIFPRTSNLAPRENAEMPKNFDGYDWSAYTIGELQKIADDITNEIQTKREEKKKTLLEQFQKLLSSEGLTIEDVIGTKRRGRPRKRGALPVRFRDPETGKGWSGRGRKPVWLVDKLQAGMKLEEFAVESTPAENPDEPEEKEVSPAT